MKRILAATAIVFLTLFIIYANVITPYRDHVRFGEEVRLQQSLWTMRRAIDFYWQDKEHPPKSLQELVSAGYLREIPTDPITKSNRIWVVEIEKASSVPNVSRGVSDVHSGASGADQNGKAYNRY